MTAIAVAEHHVQRITTLRRAEGEWRPARSTRGQSPDHRRIAIWHRAKDRTQRRALLLLAACDGPTPREELVRLERLMVEADRLAARIP